MPMVRDFQIRVLVKCVYPEFRQIKPPMIFVALSELKVAQMYYLSGLHIARLAQNYLFTGDIPIYSTNLRIVAIGLE